MSSVWTTAGTWWEISTKSHQGTRTSNVMQFSVVILPFLVRPPIVTEQPILVMEIAYDCFLRNERRIKPAVSWWDKNFPLWPHAFFTRVIILHYQIIMQFQLKRWTVFFIRWILEAEDQQHAKSISTLEWLKYSEVSLTLKTNSSTMHTLKIYSPHLHSEM